ncbi:MAG TPA: methyl-accepting chemotaxis protein [Usitatibacter sp.]|nr:methyl-accepting chemotaxis protein [Usitatibacter sp.]
MAIRTQLLLLVIFAASAVVMGAMAVRYSAALGMSALEFEHRESLRPMVSLGAILTRLQKTASRLSEVLADLVAIDDASAQAAAAARDIDAQWRDYSAHVHEGGRAGSEETRLVLRGDAGLATVNAFYDRLQSAYAANDRKALEALSRDDWRQVDTSYIEVLGKLVALKTAQSQENFESSKVTLATTRELSTIAGALSIVVLLILARAIRNGVTLAMGETLSVADRIAAGELRARVTSDRGGEIGKVHVALNRMATRLEDVVKRVRRSSEAVASASSEIADGNQHLSTRTEEQAASLEETSASMEQVAAAVRQNAESARQANALATSSSSVATKGGEVVSQVVQTMDEIQANARRIAEIVSVMDGIAFQTNILALNAAVEAARAGAEGRGFAVVASEVRVLAQRSAVAAREIKALIAASTESVVRGADLAGRARGTMDEILACVQRVATFVSDICAASSEQDASIGQVNQAIARMHTTTQQNAALVEQAAAAAESLHAQAADLADTVRIFTVEEAARDIAAAPPAHPPVSAMGMARLPAPAR